MGTVPIIRNHQIRILKHFRNLWNKSSFDSLNNSVGNPEFGNLWRGPNRSSSHLFHLYNVCYLAEEACNLWSSEMRR
jgi:hypothetical protein